MNNEGWVSIHRKIQNNFIWESKEPFDKRSAFIDLILSANHKDKEIMVGQQYFVVHRGQRYTSVRHLAEKWHWSKDKAQRYLDLLISAGMIYKDSDQYGTLITIRNYDRYQGEQGRGKSIQKERNTEYVPKAKDDTPKYEDEEDDDDGMDSMECKRIWEEQQKELEQKQMIAPPEDGGEWQ